MVYEGKKVFCEKAKFERGKVKREALAYFKAFEKHISLF